MALVEAGLAWHYKQYSDDPVLAAAEVVAKARKVGVWSLPNPTAPWAYRAEFSFGCYEVMSDKGSAEVLSGPG